MLRHPYFMNQMSFVPMKVGRLQTLLQFPVLAGDSIECHSSLIARLSPLRTSSVIEPILDTFAFFVPHRHIYGEKWQEFIMTGMYGSVTMPLYTVKDQDYNYLACHLPVGSTCPPTTIAGYNRIWNRYFRIPSDHGLHSTYNSLGPATDDQGPLDRIGKKADYAMFGRPCAWPKNIWNTCSRDILPDSLSKFSQEYPHTEIDLADFAEFKSQYATLVARTFKTSTDRYTDFMKVAFGTSVNTDADERPTLLMHKSDFLSGYDVDGAGQGVMGKSSTKSVSQSPFNIPKRFYTEHGTIWIMALLRYPLAVFKEAHYLLRKSNPSYLESVGDPRLIADQAPYPQRRIFKDMCARGDTDDYNEKMPYGNWLRDVPCANVHPLYFTNKFLPFLNADSEDFSTYGQAHYIDCRLYDNVFQDGFRLGHAQVNAKFNFAVQRIVPPAAKSLYVGS